MGLSMGFMSAPSEKVLVWDLYGFFYGFHGGPVSNSPSMGPTWVYPLVSCRPYLKNSQYGPYMDLSRGSMVVLSEIVPVWALHGFIHLFHVSPIRKVPV